MSNEPSSPAALGGSENLSRDELMSALFANMVAQQTNMALVFLGKVPHPETNQPIRDLDAAQMFIDQLEMLSAKTRGNLDKNEERLLQQSLMMLRMEFVHAVEQPAQARGATQPPTAGFASAQAQSSGATPLQAPPSDPGPETATETATSPETATEESRKRFSKKY